jgi:hypothetical protein
MFYYENQPVAECVGFKSLPQGSALSSFSYSFYTSQADRVLPVRCLMLQYADDLAVYAAHVDVENVQQTVQSACAGLNEFIRDMRLSISESRSELVLFSFSLRDTIWSMYVCCTQILVSRCDGAHTCTTFSRNAVNV